MAADPAAFDIFTPQASANASQVDTLFFSLTGISLVMMVVLGLLVFGFCLRFRHGMDVPRRPQAPRLQGALWEFGWTLIPGLVFLALFAWAAGLYLDQEKPPAEALEIRVVGKQWMWKFQHPDGQREINELHLPRGRPVRLVMATQDVIHSFYVPAFRLKQDLVPGLYTQLWFTPSRAGVYRLFCAEYCGTEHSRMGGKVVVLEPAGYQAWLDARGPTPSLAEQGASLYRSLGCSGCHEPGSTVQAPGLTGLYGRPVALADGAVVIADEAYLRDAILLPDKHVVAGFAPIMPSFTGQLDEEDLLMLIAYIQSLALEQTP